MNILSPRRKSFRLKYPAFLLTSALFLGILFSFVLFPAGASAATQTQSADTGIIYSSGVNFRAAASTDSKIVGRFDKGDRVTLITFSGEWIKVKFNAATGWVRSDFIRIDGSSAGLGLCCMFASIDAKTVNLRASDDLNAKILDKLSINDPVMVFAIKSKWAKVMTAEKQTGWVYIEYLYVKTGNSSSSGSVGSVGSTGSSTSSRSSASETRETDSLSALRGDIVAYAKTLAGTRYVYGGCSKSGFDCSGFVKYVFAHFGIELNRSSYEQATQGVTVSRSDLLPGDLVFFDTSGGKNSIDHVGIYCGGDILIHASSSRRCVVQTSFSGYYFSEHFMKAKRIVR